MTAHVAGRNPRRLARIKLQLRGHSPSDKRCIHHRDRARYPILRDCRPCAQSRFLDELREFRAGGGQGLVLPGAR